MHARFFSGLVSARRGVGKTQGNLALRGKQEFNWSLTGVWMVFPISIKEKKDELSTSQLSARKICAAGGAAFETYTLSRKKSLTPLLKTNIIQ